MEQKNEKTNSYLTFKLGEEEFGVHVSQVINILEMTRIIEVPRTPSYMKGVINLRGTALPVIDTRLRLGLEEAKYSHNTCIVVLDLEHQGETYHVGAIVDEVLSVVEIEAGQVEPPPAIGDEKGPDFIFGMTRIDDRFTMLLDMQGMMDEREMEKISQAAGERQSKVAS